MKIALMKASGYLFLFCGIFLILVGVSMKIEGDPKSADAGLPAALTGLLIFVLPGGLLLNSVKKSNSEQEQLHIIAGIVSSYRRISLDEISQKSGIPAASIMKLLAKALKKNLITGYFDRTTGEFCTGDVQNDEARIKFCTSCGSPFDKIFLKGDTVKCPRCGVIIS
jgi:hypothetical protein